MKCLELQPSDRYASAVLLADDLRRARDGLQVSVRRIGAIERAQRWFRREPRLATATTIAALALLLGATTTTWQWKDAVTQRDAAKAERDRATIASEIGAHLFAYQGDEDMRADDLITWLRKRLPGDEQRQAEALSAFVASIDAKNPDVTVKLLNKVVAVLGIDYRRQMIRSLQVGTDPYRHLYAALLAWNDERESPDPKTFAASMRSAIAEHPEDPLVWQVAAVYCPTLADTVRCLFPQAAEQLVRLDPDNMYAWLVLAVKTPDARRSQEALHKAAELSRYDDYLGRTYTAYWNAVEVAGVSAPLLIARPVQIVAPAERPEWGIAFAEAENAPVLDWTRLVTLCGVKVAVPVTEAQVLADCRLVGIRMLRSNASLISRMIGVAIASARAGNPSEIEEARQVRKLYTYLNEVGGRIGPDLRARYTPALWLHDMSNAGEMAALQHRARFFGFSDVPPADWKPEDPMVLQSGRERYDRTLALNRDARKLVAQGKYQEAVALMAPLEMSMRNHYANNWMLARFLTTLGGARLGRRDFSGANIALGDAWSIANNYGPGSTVARDCAQAMAELYTAWNEAETGKGYDVRASEWKRTLATLEANGDD
jgi:hypothetical protein